MNQRLKQITYLRAFAALSIVMIHVTSGYVSSGPVGAALNQFPRFGSPVFVMMSGFILSHIELIRPSRSYFDFFKHRFLKVTIPYVIWTVFYSTYAMFSRPGPDTYDALTVLKTLLSNIITGTGYVHLYFILIMVQLYALFPLLKKAMERYTYTSLTTAALISLVFQALIYLHRLSIITLPSIGIAYATLFPGWLFLFCMGIYLKMRLERVMAFWQERKLLCALIWFSLLIITVLEERVSPVNISLRPIVSLYAISTFFFFYLIFDTIKDQTGKRLDQTIEWIANNSFHIYLVHPLILNLLVKISPWTGYHGLGAFYITAVICTCLAIYILNSKTIRKKLYLPHWLRG